MSFSMQIAAAIGAARTYAQIDLISREIWAAHAARILDDDSAQAAAEALEARKRSMRDAPSRAARKAFGAPPKRRPAPRSPDKARSIARRRSCATSGTVPSRIACQFTTAETAALAVIAGEVRQRGVCALPIDAIAALAGTSRSVVKRACRLAEELGLLTVTMRPRPGQKHLSNLVKIISADWRAWLRLTDRGPKSDCDRNQVFNNGQAHGKPQRSGLSDGRSGEATPSRPDARGPVERHDRLEVAPRRAEAILAEKARAITG